MAGQTYEQAMRQEARRLISEHGDLLEVRCISAPPDSRIELLFANGHEEIITRHSGRIDITMMKFGYAGTGTECFWAFLDEAGFEDGTLKQLQTMQGPQVLRRDQPAVEGPATEKQLEQEASEKPAAEPTLPLWEEVSRNPSLLDPLVLQQLDKSMCIVVRDEKGPVAALVVRGSPDELRTPLNVDTPMSLYVHTFRAATFQLYGVYPIIWDDPEEPFFKETWLVGAGTVTGPPDPLSEGQLGRLESLLTQEYTYVLVVNRSNQVVAARKVCHTPATQQHLLNMVPGARAARHLTVSHAQFIAGLTDYTKSVSLTDIRTAARRLAGLEIAPQEEQPLPAAPTGDRGERVYPWRGKSKLSRTGTALLGIVWFFLCSYASGVTMAMQGVEFNWLLWLLLAFFVLAVPASCLVEALRPTRIRELVISPQKVLLFRRKSGEEKPVFAKVTRISESKRGKRLLLRGRSPGGKNVQAEINESNLQEGDWERLKHDLRTIAPQAEIEVATRHVWARRAVAALCSIPATLALLGALFVGASIAYDLLEGTISIPMSLQTQIALSLGLLVAFVVFAAASTVVSDRRIRIGAMWAVLLLLGILGAGVIVVGITGGGEEGGKLPIVAPLATRFLPVPTPTPGTAFADQIVAYNPGAAQNAQYSDPQAAIGPPDLVEQPCCSGMLQLGAGGSVLLAFTDNAIYDAAGPDFRILGESVRDDFILVEVSADGQVWRSYPKTSECPEPFDLADVGLEEVVFVRITDVQPGTATGAELDAVEAIHTGSPLEGGLSQNLPNAVARVGFTLREAPGEDSFALSEVPDNSTLAIHECTQDATWVLVQTADGQMGWCSAADLALNVSLSEYRGSEPSPGPSPAAQGTVPTALTVELGEALSGTLAQVTITGQGLERIDLLLESLSEEALEINIPAGTIFLAQTAGTQNMVVRKPRVVVLPTAGSKESVTLSAACANMELDAPGESDHFVVSTAPVPEDLIKLLNLPAFLEEPFRVQQFAIWTTTDNPPRGGYIGLGYFGVGSGPSDEEMERIRALFQQAGIPTERYQALQ